METRVTFCVAFLLFKVLDCYGQQRRECSERCASFDSDAELRFPQALRCTDSDSWRLEQNSLDVYFCRFGNNGFPHESGRKNIEFNGADGSFTVFRLQQSDEGLYEIWHDYNRTMCVELVVRPDEKSCKEALGGQSGQGIVHSDSADNGIITDPKIIASVAGTVLIFAVFSYWVRKKISKCKEGPAEQNDNMEMSDSPTVAKRDRENNQDTTDALMKNTVQSQNAAS